MFKGLTYDWIIIDDLSRSMRRLPNQMAIETTMSEYIFDYSPEITLVKPKNQPYGPQKRGRKGKVKKY